MIIIKTILHESFKDEISKNTIKLRNYQIRAIKAVFDRLDDNKDGYVSIAKGCGNSTTSFRLAQLLAENNLNVVYMTNNNILRELPQEITFKNFKSLIDDIEQNNLVCTSHLLLNNAIKKSNKKFNLKKCIFIYDECNWAWTNNKHEHIKNFFKQSLFYGFTASPIYCENLDYCKTSSDIFSKELYSYKLIDAYADGYIKPFKINYFKTPANKRKKIHDISDYIINNQKKNSMGILVTDLESIPKYYKYLKEKSNLNIGTFFQTKNEKYAKNFKRYLEEYNQEYNTSFDLKNISSIKKHIFNNKDIELLIIPYKNKTYIDKIDLSKTNTLYFDKVYKDPLSIILKLNNETKCYEPVNINVFKNIKSKFDNNLKIINKNKHIESESKLREYDYYITEFNKKYAILSDKLPDQDNFDKLKEEKKEEVSTLINEMQLIKKNIKTFFEYNEKDLKIGSELFEKYVKINREYKNLKNDSIFKLNHTDIITREYISRLIKSKSFSPIIKSKIIHNKPLNRKPKEDKLNKYLNKRKNSNIDKIMAIKDKYPSESSSTSNLFITHEENYSNNKLESINYENHTSNYTNIINKPKPNTRNQTTGKWEYSNWTDVWDEVKEAFPFDKPRTDQLETISEIQYAISKGFKYIILEAGTGTGKSVIAATSALLQENSYILTKTKQLQKQYLEDFEEHGFKEVKGRQNFDCKVIRDNCENGKCKIDDDYDCSYGITKSKSKGWGIAYEYLYWKSNAHCKYYQQKIDGLKCPHIITNYAYALVELNHVEDFRKRDLLVLDEAHNVESILMDHLTLKLEREELKKNVGINLSKESINDLKKGPSYWIKFAERILNKYETEYYNLSEVVKNSGKDLFYLQSKIYTLKNNIDDIKFFIKQVKKYPDEWTMEYNAKNLNVSFKPIKIDRYAKDVLFRYGKTCLFMSATILDYKQFTKDLGINEDEVYAIRRKSPFDISRHPIYNNESVNMRSDNLAVNMYETIPIINKILNKHPKDKGVIHSISYNCKNFINEEIANKRFITHDSKNREKIIKEFKETASPKVLISPSINEGVDLPYDDCRFQIIYKVPYPNLNKQVKARKERDEDWYFYKTAIYLLQTYGRGMRAEDDSCVTYIVDSRLTNFIYKNRRLIPDYFIDAIQN